MLLNRSFGLLYLRRRAARVQHLCLVFEKLDVNLFELLRRNGFRCGTTAYGHWAGQGHLEAGLLRSGFKCSGAGVRRGVAACAARCHRQQHWPLGPLPQRARAHTYLLSSSGLVRSH